MLISAPIQGKQPGVPSLRARKVSRDAAPHAPTANSMVNYLLYLQRTAGNHAVNSLLRRLQGPQASTARGWSNTSVAGTSQDTQAISLQQSRMLAPIRQEIGTRGAGRARPSHAGGPANRINLILQRVEWEKKINYKDGDLMYGVSPHYGDAAKAVKKAQVTPQNYPARIQSFIDYVMPDEDGDGYDKLQDEAKSKDDEQFFTWLTTQSKYKDKITKRLNKQDTKILKQICKAGIQYIAAGKRSVENKIHFILAGMDPKRSADPKEKGTTNKELRSIYRTWGNVKSSVLFYDKDGDITPAPWEDPSSKSAWEQYDHYRKNKVK